MNNDFHSAINHETTMENRQSTVLSLRKKKGKQPLKAFRFLWLDPDVNQNEQIRSAIKHMEKFVPCALSTDNYNECKQWLKNYKGNKKLLLIVSNKFGKQIMHDVHSLPSLISIYVFCLDRKIHTKWTRNYSKVRNVSSEINKLTQKLLMDIKNPNHIKDRRSPCLIHQQSSDHAELSDQNKTLEQSNESQGSM